MKHLYIRIPEELHASVKASAAHKGVSMNQLVISALETWLNSITVTGVFEIDDNDKAGQVVLNFNPYDLKKLEKMLGNESSLWEPEWYDAKNKLE